MTNFDFEFTPQIEDAPTITFRAVIEYDHEQPDPWDHCDGHGIVSEWTKRNKRPGELVLNEDGRGYKRFYDFQETMKIAKRDGWNCARTGEELEEAVRRDFNYLRAWCNDDWCYVGVIVYPLTDDGDELKSKSMSLWGIESTDTDYIQQTAIDLAREILA